MAGRDAGERYYSTRFRGTTIKYYAQSTNYLRSFGKRIQVTIRYNLRSLFILIFCGPTSVEPSCRTRREMEKEKTPAYVTKREIAEKREQRAVGAAAGGRGCPQKEKRSGAAVRSRS